MVVSDRSFILKYDKAPESNRGIVTWCAVARNAATGHCGSADTLYTHCTLSTKTVTMLLQVQ